MDLITGVVIVGTVWSIIAGAGLYVYYTAITSRQLEEFKQENITLRAQNRPKEWWQELLLEISKHPEYLDKLPGIVSNPAILQAMQSLKR